MTRNEATLDYFGFDISNAKYGTGVVVSLILLREGCNFLPDPDFANSLLQTAIKGTLSEKQASWVVKKGESPLIPMAILTDVVHRLGPGSNCYAHFENQ